MRRISTATKVVDKFGPGKHGFTNGNAVGGVPATDLEDVWFDHIQEEAANVIEWAGLTLDANDRTQLLTAILSISATPIGFLRNGKMTVTAASASATFTADEVTVGVGVRRYRLLAFNKTVNLATVGAGGMDSGTAPTSGFVALYAIFNPSNGSSSILATNAPGLVGEVYGGANMPAGYTASALIGIWPTNASKQFIVGAQQDREVFFAFTSVLSTSTQQASATSLNISATVPANAKKVQGYGVITSSASAANLFFTVTGSSAGVGGMQASISTSQVSAGISSPFANIPLAAAQTLFYTATASAGTMSFSLVISGYSF